MNTPQNYTSQCQELTALLIDNLIKITKLELFTG